MPLIRHNAFMLSKHKFWDLHQHFVLTHQNPSAQATVASHSCLVLISVSLNVLQCLLCLCLWIWCNFTCYIMRIKFLLCIYFSKWSCFRKIFNVFCQATQLEDTKTICKTPVLVLENSGSLDISKWVLKKKKNLKFQEFLKLDSISMKLFAHLPFLLV